ncbi:Fe(3+)-hydroxamate ABC transporter permease FhuB [Microvirga guangxiensis]|uniref:Iron complex transport system permease protein n=1 Tax=Microvirga guangxiensis TaxID=549386 RepID=A0A1G5ECN4_9HYPH|nr:Fe(3+)-hydroxamate ABC transporter permease FhuB [Microvirga guangxiensis]SCY24726.1 iron complex transport system permease protein [Microvirga guangxiensis]
MQANSASRSVVLAAGLAALAVTWAIVRLNSQLPLHLWTQAWLHPSLEDAQQLLFHYSALPRLVTAVLCGAALGLAGTIFQHVLRNPLASPTTLGVEAGAQLALVIATIWAPFLLGVGREFVAVAGALGVTALIFAVSSARGFSSLTLILAGLVMSLFCGSLVVALKLLNQEYISSLYIWGAGSLAQQDWSAVTYLLPRLLGCAFAAALLARPLVVLTLSDESASALGVSLRWLRIAALFIAVLLTAFVTSAVGIIGFIGLAAPQIARLSGARRFQERLVVAPLMGAGLLVLVDQAAQASSGSFSDFLPTGAVTALLGAPLLLWLLPQLKSSSNDLAPGFIAPATAYRPGILFPLLMTGLVAVTLASILLGRSTQGWSIADGEMLAALAEWRVPRTSVALLGGAMLGMAGVLLQRLTRNPVASPEVLGIGTGVAIGILLSMVISTAPGRGLQLAMSSAGAFTVLAFLLWRGIKSRSAPDQMLLTGIALSAFLDAIIVSFIALGDPRAAQLLAWLAGSTYRADATTAWMTLAIAAPLLLAPPFFSRTLDILPLGEETARELGVDLRLARLAIMGLTAFLTAASVLAIGPLTFAGLVGPHLARAIGLRRAFEQLIGAALIGAILMILADWLGRIVIFPFQLPAGLVAALIGVPYLIWHLTRRGR